MKPELKTVFCGECENVVDASKGYCSVCDGDFEGEPLDWEDYE